MKEGTVELRISPGEWLRDVAERGGVRASDVYKAYLRQGGDVSQATLYRMFDPNGPMPELPTLVFLIAILERMCPDLDVQAEFAEWLEITGQELIEDNLVELPERPKSVRKTSRKKASRRQNKAPYPGLLTSEASHV